MLNSKNVLRSLLGVAALSLFACGPKAQNNDTSPLKSFAEFSAGLQQEVSPTCNDRCLAHKAEFKYVIYVGVRIYCYWDEKQAKYGMNLNDRAKELEDQITSDTTETQYFLILTKWAASLKDGHVNALLRDNLSKLEFYDVPVRFEVLAPGTDHEKLVVAKVGGSVNKLKAGMVVDKIQGKKWQEYEDAYEKFASGSTLAMRRRGVNNIFRVLLEQEGPKSVQIEGILNGKKVSEVINRNISLYDGSADAAEPEETGINLLKPLILENNIGYLRIDGFSGSRMPILMNQAMDRLAGTDGLIIDVRKNGGGDLSGDAILQRLAEKDIVRFSQKAVFSDYLIALRPSIITEYSFPQGPQSRFSDMIDRGVSAAPPGQRYTKPVYVLTSANCFSACDTFVTALKENKLAEVVGEATGGGTGNPLVFTLPGSGHSFRYSVAQGFKPVSHELLEGSGTQPDIILEPTAEERAAGQDLQLQKTAQLMAKKVSQLKNMPAPEKTTLPPELLVKSDSALSGKPFEVESDREARKAKD